MVSLAEFQRIPRKKRSRDPTLAHWCGQLLCANPGHLRVATQMQNFDEEICLERLQEANTLEEYEAAQRRCATEHVNRVQADVCCSNPYRPLTDLAEDA